MKLKNKILKLGTALAVVAPIAAIVSCGSDTKIAQDSSKNNDITDKINNTDDIYTNPYSYNDFLANNKTKYDASNGELTLDIAALRKFPEAYPIDANEFNSEVWSKVTKDSVVQQLKNSGKTINIDDEVKKVSATSAPLSLHTSAIYYSYFDSSAPDSNGNTTPINPGFYHIRPQSKTDILADPAKTDWNSISADASTDIKQKLKVITGKSTNNLLTEGDQIILNTNTEGSLSKSLSSNAYTYYENYYDNGVAKPLTSPGFYIAKPSAADGSGVKTIAMSEWVKSDIKFSAEQNKFDVDKIQTTADKGVYKLTTYGAKLFQPPIKTESYIYVGVATPKLDDIDHTYGKNLAWNPATPFSYKHLLNEKQANKTFDKNHKDDVENAFKIDATNKDVFKFMQPDSKWISPVTAQGGTRITIDVTTLSYNDKKYKLTRSASADKDHETFIGGYFYDADEVNILDTDNLYWKNADTNEETVLGGLSAILSPDTGDANAFDGIMKAHFGGHTFTIFSKYDDANKTAIPSELQGFYITRPKNEDEARSKMLNLNGVTNKIDDTATKALPFDISNPGKTIKILVGGVSKDVTYWEPSNMGSMKVEVLYGTSSKHVTKTGFELTGMVSKDAQTGEFITQQDKGFAPVTNSGTWGGSSGSLEEIFYKYVDFIEVNGTTDYYYQHEYFNTENGIAVDLKSKTIQEREKYRLPMILRGFYKNGTKLDISEYKTNESKYIEDSLSAVTATKANQHDKFIFKGLNGSKAATTYKGVIYPNKSINGMTVHTTWGPTVNQRGGDDYHPYYVQLQNKDAEWLLSDGKTKITKPGDYFSVKQMYFGQDVFCGTEKIKDFTDQVTNIPFEGINKINFVWGNDALTTIDIEKYSDLAKVIEVLKNKIIFQGNIKSVIGALSLAGKSNIFNKELDEVKDELFGTDSSTHNDSLMGKIAEELEKFTKIKNEGGDK